MLIYRVQCSRGSLVEARICNREVRGSNPADANKGSLVASARACGHNCTCAPESPPDSFQGGNVLALVHKGVRDVKTVSSSSVKISSQCQYCCLIGMKHWYLMYCTRFSEYYKYFITGKHSKTLQTPTDMVLWNIAKQKQLSNIWRAKTTKSHHG